MRLLLERGKFCSCYCCCSETAVGKRENSVSAADVAVRLLLERGNSVATAAVVVRLLLERGEFCSCCCCCSETAVGNREILYSCCGCGEIAVGMGVELTLLSLLLLLPLGNTFFMFERTNSVDEKKIR